MSDFTTSTIATYVKSGSTWLEFANTSATVPGQEADTIEVTNSKSGRYRRFAVSTLIDPGTFDFTVNHVPSDPTFQYLQSLVGSTTASIWKTKFLFDGEKELEFTGSLVKYNTGAAKVGEILTADASVKVSGPVSGAFA